MVCHDARNGTCDALSSPRECPHGCRITSLVLCLHSVTLCPVLLVRRTGGTLSRPILRAAHCSQSPCIHPAPIKVNPLQPDPGNLPPASTAKHVGIDTKLRLRSTRGIASVHLSRAHACARLPFNAAQPPLLGLPSERCTFWRQRMVLFSFVHALVTDSSRQWTSSDDVLCASRRSAAPTQCPSPANSPSARHLLATAGGVLVSVASNASCRVGVPDQVRANQ